MLVGRFNLFIIKLGEPEGDSFELVLWRGTTKELFRFDDSSQLEKCNWEIMMYMKSVYRRQLGGQV